MVQALSEEEFHRMQAQLLELRTHNYQLSDDLRKNTADLNCMSQKTITLERDLIKVQKALSKSKKAQEVDALLSENEMLQGKLHSQEDDFRLQNSTLMQELSKLCTQIELLEQQNQELRERHLVSSTSSTLVDGESLRLQAENSALQKKMTAIQQCYDKIILQRHRGQACETDHTAIEGSINTDEHSESKIRVGEQTSETTDILKQAEDISDMEWRVNRLCEMELQLTTEVEEKKLLKEQLQALEFSRQTEITKLHEELDKLSDRLKKKQESFMHLQGEKEALYNDSITKIDELNQKKEEELKSMNIRIQKLQADLTAANQLTCQRVASDERMENILTESAVLRTNLAALEQIQTVKTKELNLLKDQNVLLGAELQQRLIENESLLARRDDLTSQLQELSFANSKFIEDLAEEGRKRDKLLHELNEAKKTGEKRKSMLDELAIQMNQEKSDHKEAISDLRLHYEKEVLGVRARYEKELRGLHEDKCRSEEEIRAQLQDEKTRSKELEGLQQGFDELTAQVQSMEGAKGWFERRLKEAEEAMGKKALENQEEIERLQQEHALQLKAKVLNIEEVQLKLEETKKQIEEETKTNGRLKQDIKDTLDGQKILEKKGSAVLKDLKRQLQLERKRADKLQERLQEILTNTKTRTGLEDLVLSEIGSPCRTQQTGDSSSISSFSYREMLKEPSHASTKSTTGSPQSQRPADLSDNEVGELFQRLAEVQQEKWMLEEKVKHLEVSCSSMAEDICRKSAIIETYVLDSKTAGSHSHHGAVGQTEKVGLGSVLREMVKSGDENLKEMNKKLQNMLEEQLTKNMHLQKDLEVLSQEIVRLSKCSGAGGSGTTTE